MRLLQRLPGGDGLGYGVTQLFAIAQVGGDVGLLPQAAVAADEIFEVHGFYFFHVVHFVGGDGAEGQAVNGDPIGGEEHVCAVDEAHDGVVVGVDGRLVDHFDALAAEVDA